MAIRLRHTCWLAIKHAIIRMRHLGEVCPLVDDSIALVTWLRDLRHKKGRPETGLSCVPSHAWLCTLKQCAFW